MTLPTWTTIPDTDVDQDSPAKQTNVMRRQRDNAAATRFVFVPLVFTEKSTTSPVWVPLDQGDNGARCWVPVPEIGPSPGVEPEIIVRVEARVASGTAFLALLDVAAASQGAGVATVVGSSWAFYEVSASVLVPDRQGTIREILVMGRTDGGQLDVRRSYSISGRLEY